MSNILIGVTGCIAAYKAASVVSVLSQKHDVKVIMTENAKQFVGPLTFSALSHNPVYGDHNRFSPDGHIHHIELAEWADLFAIVPATYNTIIKIIQCHADNLLTSTLIPYRAKENARLIICPAMNFNMWKNLQAYILMHEVQYIYDYFVGPIEGKMACGSIGKGKLAKTRDIINKIQELL